MRSVVRVVSLWVVASLMCHCATDNAAQLREERQFSIGVWGAGYRPNPDIGVGLTGSMSSDGSNGFGSNFMEISKRNVNQSGQSIGLSVVKFPWKTSAFCFGLGISTSKGEVAFDADVVDGSSEMTRVKYTRSATYVGVPIGWYWIWEKGITFALNLGPNYRIAHKTSLAQDGGAKVDAGQRDDFISSMENSNRITWGGFGLMGYSF